MPTKFHLVIAFLLFSVGTSANAETIDFQRDIRPTLSDKCFVCHGPDAGAREADLRLDVREAAISILGPGTPDSSEFVARISTDDVDAKMPPAHSNKRLTKGEISKLRQWIADGAPYSGHWSFEPILNPKLPSVSHSDWTRNEIDFFILSRLEREGMTPSKSADGRTLLRRITLDLTGLPPSLEDYQSLEASQDFDAVIDQLMNSPRYGEHMAWRWLDAARYADSDGYESDPLRNMWPWRDWVVEAFNRHMPYDQFIIEQLAGDQLENPTLRQVLATGFNRNHRLNNEGGVDPAEWLIEYVCDRAETTATVFMGLTWQCARCHDHKFDPITAKDYYQLFDFFHQLPEIGNGRGSSNAPPMIEVSDLTNLNAFADLKRELDPLASELAQHESSAAFKEQYAAWFDLLKVDPESVKTIPGKLGETEFAKWDKKMKAEAKTYYLRNQYMPARDLVRQIAPLEKRLARLKGTGAKVMVMGDRAERRKSFILRRGAFDQPTDEVSADTPSFLPPMDNGLPKNRLGLARWLVDPKHPLTARVAVNRTWERFFGTGLVKTPEDFGAQGELPSHPELLDYLATRLIESEWDLQGLQKLILTSATYRQSSHVSDEAIAKDPENRLLARAPRYRLPAPVIRDQALAASGLLVERIGGKPVKPYQPPGLWREIIKGRVAYKRDTGEKLYRRSLYTLWRRAVEPPLMSLLDANGRDTCAVDLKRTNTPLQALLLLNDETFVELARGLATRMIEAEEGGSSDETRISAGYEFVLGRKPTEQESRILLDELRKQREYFRTASDYASSFIAIGERKPPTHIDPIELAATTSVARVLLNLDETLTKE